MKQMFLVDYEGELEITIIEYSDGNQGEKLDEFLENYPNKGFGIFYCMNDAEDFYKQIATQK